MVDFILILISQSVLALVALLIFLFTLKVMTSFKAIHGNCKFFLMFTAVGQFLIILAHILKLQFWFSVGNIDNVYTIEHYKIQSLHEFGSALVDLNNFFLIAERIIASKKLKRYEEAGTHWIFLFPSEAGSLILSAVFSYLMHFEQKVLECIIFAFVFEVFALFLLVLCYAHSTKAYGNLKDVNIQYQMREVEHITRALLPACLTSVLLRAAITVMALLAILIPTMFPTFLSFQAVYSSTLHSTHYFHRLTSCGHLSIPASTIPSIFRYRPSIRLSMDRGTRHRAKNLLLKCFGRAEVAPSSPQISQIDKRKEAYFDQLQSSWD